MNPTIKYIKKEFDEILIASTLVKIAFHKFETLDDEEIDILNALKRVKPELHNLSNNEIGNQLEVLNDNQLTGLTSNVKGVLHEIQFVEIENNDGDSVTATMFTDSNHQDTDVLLKDNITGEITEIQLKATNNSSYVQDWIDNHPDGHILVTDEIAEKMNLETSGLSNQELTTDVNSFIDQLIELDENDELWDYIPLLPGISVAICGIFLIKKYKNGEMSFDVMKPNSLN